MAKEKSPLAEMHLVLVHAPEQERPVGTAEWLKHRPKIKQHHHIKVDREADFQRLARVITGQTVGVVLSGGGARGCVGHAVCMRGRCIFWRLVRLLCVVSFGINAFHIVAQHCTFGRVARADGDGRAY